MGLMRKDEFRNRLRQSLRFFGRVIDSPELEAMIPDGGAVYFTTVSSLSSSNVEQVTPASISTATPKVEGQFVGAR